MSSSTDATPIEARLDQLIDEQLGPMRVREKLLADGYPTPRVNDALMAVAPERWKVAASARLAATYGDPATYDFAKKAHAFRDLRRRGYQERLIRELVYPEMLMLDAPFEVITKPDL